MKDQHVRVNGQSFDKVELKVLAKDGEPKFREYWAKRAWFDGNYSDDEQKKGIDELWALANEKEPEPIKEPEAQKEDPKSKPSATK